MLVKGPLSPAISTLQLCRMHHFVTRYLLGIWLLSRIGIRCTRSLRPCPTSLLQQQLLFCCPIVENLAFTPVFSILCILATCRRKPPLSSPTHGVSGILSRCVVCPWAVGSCDFCSQTPSRAHNPVSYPLLPVCRRINEQRGAPAMSA